MSDVRKPLTSNTIQEWKKFVEKLLCVWMGRLSLSLIIDKIDNNLKKDGKPWTDATKCKCAKKAQEFGAWMAKPNACYVKTNPFHGLANQYTYQKTLELCIPCDMRKKNGF